jgi:hypothetical protein
MNKIIRKPVKRLTTSISHSYIFWGYILKTDLRDGHLPGTGVHPDHQAHLLSLQDVMSIRLLSDELNRESLKSFEPSTLSVSLRLAMKITEDKGGREIDRLYCHHIDCVKQPTNKS